MGDWKNFGVVAGVFWVHRFGVYFTTSPETRNYRGSDFTAYRFWPFVFIVADRG